MTSTRPGSLALASLVTLTSALGLAGCDGAAQKLERTADKVGAFAEKTADDVGRGTNDAAITVAVKAAMAGDGGVKAARVHVTTNAGVVLLTGTQPTKEAKEWCEHLTRGTQGVRDVVNQIEIAP